MIRLEIWGDFASFNRPELKVERYSYDIITPSAARNILQAIYWHPCFDWVIDRIYLLSPIKRINFKRNEMKNKGSYKEMKGYAKGGKPSHLIVDTTQRSAVLLKDVHYVIEAHFIPKDNRKEDFNEKKIYAIFCERAKNGQYYTKPFLGCREFPAEFKLVERDFKPLKINKDFGLMLYDIDYSNEERIPQYFKAEMIDGVITINHKEIIR